MVSVIFGYDDDSLVDEIILRILNHIFLSLEQPVIKFDFATYISDVIHEKICSVFSLKFLVTSHILLS